MDNIVRQSPDLGYSFNLPCTEEWKELYWMEIEALKQVRYTGCECSEKRGLTGATRHFEDDIMLSLKVALTVTRLDNRLR
jgi:hypothetical protein